MEMMLYPKMTQTRRSISLDGMWKIQFDPQEIGTKKQWMNGLPKPDMIPVPASFSDFYTDKDIRDYSGDFWYETDIFVPGEWQGLNVALRFGAATHRAVIYLNGKEITSHEGGFTPFLAWITADVKWNEKNKVVVKCSNTLHEACLPVGLTEVLPDNQKVTYGFFDFFNYSGLQRSVWLISVPEDYIKDYTVSHRICGQDAEVDYIVEMNEKNDTYCVEAAVYDEDGTLAALSSARLNGKEARGLLHIQDVHLWQVRNAYLYHIVLTIKDASGHIIDVYEDEMGVRTVKIEGREILINNEPVYLKGFGKHEDSDIVGRGYNAGVVKRDFECMKWIGANSFRTAHYPYSEEIYQMADREGFLVTDELPAVGLGQMIFNFIEAANKYRQPVGFFEKKETPELLQNHLKVLEELITRDKNHACVIMWSLFNEPETTESCAVPYFKEVFERAKSLDKQKRPCTFSMEASSGFATCKCHHLSDVISLNRYYGWYISGGSAIKTAEAEMKKEMEEWAAIDKPVIFTEFGADTLDEMHKLPSVMWSQEYQTEYMEMTTKIFDSYPFVKGEQIWNFADFQTVEGTSRVNGNRKGIFTRQRQPKAAAYFFKQRWEQMRLDGKI